MKVTFLVKGDFSIYRCCCLQGFFLLNNILMKNCTFKKVSLDNILYYYI